MKVNIDQFISDVQKQPKLWMWLQHLIFVTVNVISLWRTTHWMVVGIRDTTTDTDGFTDSITVVCRKIVVISINSDENATTSFFFGGWNECLVSCCSW